MESRGDPARRKHVASPSLRTSEPACALWWLLAGKNNEDSSLYISVLTFLLFLEGKVMKNILFALAILAIAGCSSMQDLRKEPPSNTYQSKKQIDVVAECILNGWQEQSQKYGSVFIQPHEGGKTIFTQSQLEMADLKSEGEVTNIEFRHQGGLFNYRIDSRIKAIERCI